MLIAKNRREGIAVLEAGLDDFAREPLSDFDGFGYGAALGDQSRNIRTRAQVAAIAQFLDANADGRLFNVCEMFLVFHEIRLRSIADQMARLPLRAVYIA